MEVKFNYEHWSLKFFPKWVAAWTFKNNIYIRANFISPELARHEMKHSEQYAEEGIIKFLVKYLYYNIRYGYYNNPYEIEARIAEYKS